MWPSFNPCFLGTRPRTPRSGGQEPHFPGVSILVFLELALGLLSPLSGSSSPRRTRVSILVFLELALGQRAEEACNGTVYVFQSLFSWNSPSDEMSGPHPNPTFAVSILVFLELALGHQLSNHPNG